MPYYMPIVSKKGRSGATILTASNTDGEEILRADGMAPEEALETLRAMACEYMAGAAGDGEDPLDGLYFGTPDREALVFTDMDLFPIMLRHLRKQRGFTQEEMARRMGYGQPVYARLEKMHCNPTVETMARLQAIFGVSISEATYTRNHAA